ncbi:MAG: zinc ribbon domain-containing protein [Promethearchaeota archaeon]
MSYVEKELEGLSANFTPDAWQMFNSFLWSLQEKLNEFNIAQEQQISVFSGIKEYLQEYIEDYKNSVLIPFEETMELIRNIGSPSEILQALDLPIEKPRAQTILEKTVGDSKLQCRHCNWLNTSDAQFCENCGNKIVKSVNENTLTLFRQKFVDYPYRISILVSYTLLLVIGAILILSTIIDDPEAYSIGELLGAILINVFGMLVPATVLGVLFGFFLKDLVRDRALFRYKYDQLLAYFQTLFDLGFAFTMISATMVWLWLGLVYFDLLNLEEIEAYIFPIMILVVLLGCIIVFAMWLTQWNSSNKSREVPYLLLLKTKQILSTSNKLRLQSLNFKLFGLILVLSLLWFSLSAFMGSFVLTDFLNGAYLLFAFILIFNGFFLIRYNSWAYILAFISLNQSASA